MKMFQYQNLQVLSNLYASLVLIRGAANSFSRYRSWIVRVNGTGVHIHFLFKLQIIKDLWAFNLLWVFGLVSSNIHLISDLFAGFIVASCILFMPLSFLLPQPYSVSSPSYVICFKHPYKACYCVGQILCFANLQWEPSLLNYLNTPLVTPML